MKRILIAAAAGLIVLVQTVQSGGEWLARRVDKRRIRT